MTTVSDATAAHQGAAARMGLKQGDLVQELGYDDDVDFDLRDELESATGEGLLTEEDHEVADAVLLWWRDGDGDLVDALVDSLTDLEDGGVVWLLTPRPPAWFPARSTKHPACSSRAIAHRRLASPTSLVRK